ncbi:hypothetical protein [Xenorhabdus cabanillasii]|uniref:Uncharacterized protein n=1 Tax=Xenorhabdus cabanillasii JM26 TaxID=1427517 RepID=W1JA59_9GAMM|nr:hypothetical protein [Xenorhabdus cabanillasii]PHM76987.1 hypothetical protein Xcab_02555 [Xenorhabdus cabanillasii JM26]CDL86380.1 conserved hypothetical protein [Xenorhabdus cabanillasii JM26]
MRIDLGKYVITSDSRAYTLNRKRITKTGENAGQESLTPFRYYTQLPHLIRDVIRMEVDSNDIKTLQQLSERIEEIEADFATRIAE